MPPKDLDTQALHSGLQARRQELDTKRLTTASTQQHQIKPVIDCLRVALQNEDLQPLCRDLFAGWLHSLHDISRTTTLSEDALMSFPIEVKVEADGVVGRVESQSNGSHQPDRQSPVSNIVDATNNQPNPNAMTPYNVALKENGMTKGDGHDAGNPKIIGKSTLKPLQLLPPLIDLSEDVDTDRLSELRDSLDTLIGNKVWLDRLGYKQLHPLAKDIFVSLVTVKAMGRQGLGQINAVLLGARQNGFGPIVVPDTTAQASETTDQEKRFVSLIERNRSTIQDLQFKKNAFCNVRKLCEAINLIEAYQALDQEVKRDPNGPVATRIRQAVPPQSGRSEPDKVIVYAKFLLGLPEKSIVFRRFVDSVRPFWRLKYGFGLGFLMLLDSKGLNTDISNASSGFVPHFIEIVNQAFPEFQRLSKYLEVNALSHLLGRDETAFRRVADASLSVNDGFPAMMARVITAFPAADVDTVMSGTA